LVADHLDHWLESGHLITPLTQGFLVPRSTASAKSKSAGIETVAGSIYDYPVYYDVIFGADWKKETNFLEAAFEKHALRSVKSVFEPACGTGRLMVKLAQRGYKVGGNDLNPKAINYCNKKLAKAGFPESGVVGDMSDFSLKKPVDAAFNLINTVRHLPTEKHAVDHLKCMSNALAPGGIYLLGLHLMPTEGKPIPGESWLAKRGTLTVSSHMWTKKIDVPGRMEYLGMTLDVHTPTKQLRIEDEMHYRTYTAAQMRALIGKVPTLECVETYDFLCEIEDPITVGPQTEDVIYVLRKRK